MSKKWGPEADAELKALRAVGMTVPEIAEALGRDHYDVRKRCVVLGITSPPGHNGSWNKPGRRTTTEYPDYWSKNAHEGSAKLRDALFSFYERRAA